MGKCLSISRSPETSNVPDVASTITTPPPATATRSHTPSSSQYPKYDVFISHAGEDKATIAIPLREKLKAQGITAFVDEADMRPGTDSEPAMVHAMETCSVAVIVLSPEFVARKWPIKELFCFLRRREECGEECTTPGRAAPVIIPFFYRLSIAELYREPRLDRKDLYRKSRFHERQSAREPEANVEAIRGALKTLHGIMGVRNDVNASNDSSYSMSQTRDMLLQRLCDEIGQTVRPRSVKPQSEGQSVGDGPSQAAVDRFRKFFPPLYSKIPAVLDFEGRGSDGNPITTEGLVKQLLVEETSKSPRVLSIHGLGGVGKSTLMRALCVDDEIRQRFPDGVHLITLGKDASSTTLVRQLCKTLRNSGAEKTYQSLGTQNDIDAVLRFFGSWFDGKMCAFLIDDVWSHDIGLVSLRRVCSIGSAGENRVVMTTREPEVASLVASARPVQLKPREAKGLEARRILFFHAGRQNTDASSTLADESINRILEICAGLPVGLAAAGKNIRMMMTSFVIDAQNVWKHYLSKLETSRETLLDQEVELYGNLFATFVTSIATLDLQREEETLRLESRLSCARMHWRLCVLRKQDAVPDSMLEHLWETQSLKDVDMIARKFVESGLASREAVQVGDQIVWYLRLHDSVHDFAVAQAKRNDELMEAHNSLLNGYKSCDTEISGEVQGTSSWWSPKLEADGYIHGNLCRHLAGAGRTGELVQLLLSPHWVKRQVEVNNMSYVESDFALGISSVEDGIRGTSDEELDVLKEALEIILDAVKLASSYISNNVAEVWFQLHGRLTSYCERNSVIQKYVARIETEGGKPRILCKTSCLGQPGTSNTRIVPIGIVVNCMVIMQDQERIACGCDDGQIFIVNVKLGQVEHHWQAHDNEVSAIAVGPDETLLVSGSLDDTAKVWNVEDGDLVTSFSGHSDTVNDVAVMGDGRRVVSVSADGTGYVWDIETGQILSKRFGGQSVIRRNLSKLLTRHRDVSQRRIRCVATMADQDDVVVTGGMDGKLRRWNVTTGAQVGAPFDGHKSWVSCLSVTPDGRHVVSGSFDRTVRVWDVGRHQQIGHSLEGHADPIECVAVSGDGGRLVSGSWDSTIRVWDLESQTEICDPLEGHSNRVTGVAFIGGADRLVSCSWDGTVRFWDVTKNVSKKLTNRHKDGVFGVSFSPDGRFVVSGSWDRTLRVWDTTSGQQIGDPLEGHSDWVTDVAVTPDGQCVVSVSCDKTVRVWDLESRELLHTLTGHSDSIWCVAVTPQGDRIVTGSDDKTVRIWGLPVSDGDPVVLDGHSTSVGRVFVSDDGLRVVSVDWKDNIFVWDLKTKRIVKQCEKEGAWSLSRREVLSIAEEETVDDDAMLSIPLDGREIFYGQGPDATVLATLDARILCWALSPDKKTVCLGLVDGQVGFLNVQR